MPRAVVIVLDSFGVGAAPDAASCGDTGADTLGHIARWCVQQGRPLRVPHMMAMGLGQAACAAGASWPVGVRHVEAPHGAYGAASPASRGKDTPSGHWELMGCPVPFEWGVFERREGGDVFPPALMRRWYETCGLSGSLCNDHASGTEAIARFGDEHVRNGWPICYTSADSVFQVAAHEEHFGLDRLLAACEAAKRIFDELAIARVIARPFVGGSGEFRRSANRRDYTTPPPEPTLLDGLVAAGREVHAVGKIDDIFASRGVTRRWKGEDNAALCQQTLCALAECADGGMVFTNLVDFDSHYGHRRDAAGYAQALERFDATLPYLLDALRPGDLMALTADHGCDPTWPGSDHTRECVPLLFGGPAAPAGLGIGRRTSFADLGQTMARHLQVGALRHGLACWT